MSIAPIAYGDTDTRAKLNQAIAKANEVAAVQTAVAGLQIEKADVVDVVALQGVYVGHINEGRERPGDSPIFFTQHLGGEPAGIAPIEIGSVVEGPEGKVLRIAGAGAPIIVARRQIFGLESGEVYAVRYSVQRASNSSDPLNDAVQFGLAWLDRNKVVLSSEIIASEALSTFSGLMTRHVTFSRDAEAVLTAPAAARYAQPFVRMYGGNHLTDIIAVDLWRSNGLPGPRGDPGDVTPEALLARDEAIAAEASAQAALEGVAALSVSAGRYDSTAEGLAATSVHETFWVAVGDYLLLYRHETGGVAMLTGEEMPLRGALESVEDRAADLERQVQNRSSQTGFAVVDQRGNAILAALRSSFRTAALAARRLVRAGTEFAVTDEAGFALIHITRDEINHPVVGRLLSATAPLRPRIGGRGYAITDEAGNALLRVTEEGLDHPTIRSLDRQVASALREIDSASAASWPIAIALAEGLQIVIYGQSLSVGSTSLPAVSRASLGFAERFNGGVRAQDGGTDAATTHASLVPLVEQAGASNTRGETPASGLAAMFFQLLQDEDGIDLSAPTQKLLLSSPGTGGASIADLSAGDNLQRLYDDIEYGKIRIAESGRTYALSGLNWVHGEQDTNASTAPAVYKTGVRDLRALAQTKGNTVSGLSRTLPMLMCQVATHLHYGRSVPAIAMAQLELCDEPEFGFVTSRHFLTYSTDGLHLTAASSKWLGAYHGLALKRALIDGVKIKPLVPDTLERNGSTVLLRFASAIGNLVFDTVTVPNPGNYGFTLVDSGGTDIPITSVALVGRDRVVIRTASTVPAGAKLRHAWIGDGHRGIGNLRDRQGDTLIFDPTGLNRPLHRWAPIYERTLS